jgi:replicative DNA helicase
MKHRQQHEDELRDEAPGLPQATQAEVAVLGAILIKSELYYHVADVLFSEDFTLESHRCIYDSIVEMMGEQERVDMVTLCDHLRKKRRLQSVGGAAYVSSLTDRVHPHAGTLKRFAETIKDVSRRRTIFKKIHDAQSLVLDESVSLEEVAGMIEGSVLEVMSETQGSKPQKLAEFSAEVLAEIAAQHLAKLEVIGLHSGLTDIDDATTGFRDGEMTVFAARVGHGKSAFALGAALENAKNDTPAAVFTLEMRKDEYYKRALSMETMIDHLRIRDPRSLADDELDKINAYSKLMDHWPLWIDDAVLSINQLCARARMLKKRGAKLIVIDYLQLITDRESDPRLKTNIVSGALRELAKSLRIPFLVLSQLRRPTDGNRRPSIYDLKESGNIEQDAHVVLLGWRPTTSDGSFTGEDEVIIGKQRSGPTGITPAHFYGRTLSWKKREVFPKTPRPDDRQQKLTSGNDDVD